MSSYTYKRGRKKPHMVQWYTVEINAHGDRTRIRKTAYFLTKDAAEEFQGKLANEAQAHRYGVHNPSSLALFADHSKDWLRRQAKRRDYAHSSFAADESKLRKYWIEKFGPRLMTTIESAEILTHLDYLEYDLGLSPATRNRHRALMHVLFHDALVRGRVKYNPVSAVQLKEEVRVKPRVNLANDEQFAAFVAGMYAEGTVYGIIADIQGMTGARICSANALQWRDIDDAEGRVYFRRIEERAGGSKIVGRIKGSSATHDDDGAHIMPLLPRLRESLKAWRRVSRFTRPTDFIAANQETGKYVPYDTLKDVIKRVVGKTNIPPISSHAIRRYFATSLKRAGFSRAEIRELVGWSSEQMVARYDMKDVSHLAEKAARVGFGASRSGNVVQMKRKAR